MDVVYSGASPTQHDPASSAKVGAGDPIEVALARALEAAALAGRFDVVSQLARELEARRRAP